MNRGKKVLYYIFIISFSIIIIGTYLILKIPKPPSIELQHARKALFAAEIASSKKYAKYQYQEAKNYYDSAYIEWKRQNERFLLKRKYAKVIFYAKQAHALSVKTKTLAESNSRDIKKYLKEKLSQLGLFMNKYDSLIRALPLDVHMQKKYQQASLAFTESKVAYHSGDLTSSMKKISIADESLESTKFNTATYLENYFKEYKTWKSNAEKAIKTSRQKKDVVLVVDKFAKKCFVYEKGNLKHSFTVELGKNWIGNKKRKNDKATPEGIYHVEKKLDRSQTKYHKALLINYPNKDDLHRFEVAKRRGEIPSNSDIGGSIEIHGDGGKGVNWTNGCIALRNEDMDRLFSMVKSGTQVIIVGSLANLSEIIDFNIK